MYGLSPSTPLPHQRPLGYNALTMESDKYIDSYLESFSRVKDPQNPFQGVSKLPTMDEIGRLQDCLMSLFYPGRGAHGSLEEAVRFNMDHFISLLRQCVYYAYSYEERLCGTPSSELFGRSALVVDRLMRQLGAIRQLIKLDAQAGLDGDPAARSLSEVIICYPGFRAIAMHRVSHELHRMGVPLLPRMMSELIHSRTGIDIHPGAEIGESFFIDHGTGVVIGETSVIGNRVKIYQGVTLGALSFPRNACGQLLKGTKRHPTIEDDVTIYANATILGDITVGRGSTIGSSCWIKEDVPPRMRVLNRDPEMILVSKG